MKLLLNIVFIWLLATSLLVAQEHRIEKNKSEENTRSLREEQPSFKKSASPQLEAPTTDLSKKMTKAKKSEGSLQKSTPLDSKTQQGLKEADYQAAKKARLEKEAPSSSKELLVKKIKQADFNQLSAEKQQHIKSNPNLYQIIRD